MSDSVPVGAAPDVWDNVGPAVPNSARMYDYYLGGKDNFAVDREAAEKAVAAMPAIPVLARANRAFLVDSVGKMAAAGVRVPGTAAVRADVRSPEAIFASPEVEELIDFDQPCGVLMMSVLHFVGGNIAPLVARYTDRLAPGSYLALSHVVTDGAVKSELTGVQEAYEASPTDPAIRNSAAVRELFTGFEMLPPGLTDVRTFTDPTFAYSPEDPAPGIWMLCCAGRKL
jgi:S-adenosyl methyltransferase